MGNGDATSAKFSGVDILVTTSKGKTELRKESGATQITKLLHLVKVRRYMLTL